MPHQRPKVSALIVLIVACTASWMSANRAAAAKSPGLTEFETGVTLLIGHKPRQAIRHLTQSILLDPFNTMAYVYRGQAHLELEERTQALKDASKALSLDKKLVDAYDLKAHIELEQGEYKAALADATASLQLQNKARKDLLADRFKFRGKIYSNIGEDKKAFEDFSKAIELSPSNATSSCYYHRGNIYMKWGKYKQALDDYNNALKFRQDKDKERIMEMRARAYEKLGRKDLAAKERETLRTLSKEWGSLLE